MNSPLVPVIGITGRKQFDCLKRKSCTVVHKLDKGWVEGWGRIKKRSALQSSFICMTSEPSLAELCLLPGNQLM